MIGWKKTTIEYVKGVMEKLGLNRTQTDPSELYPLMWYNLHMDLNQFLKRTRKCCITHPIGRMRGTPLCRLCYNLIKKDRIILPVGVCS